MAKIGNQTVMRPAVGFGNALRLTFVIPGMTLGGSERVAATLCNCWAANGHDVHLVTYEPVGIPAQYPLDPRVHRYQLDLLRQSRSLVAFVGNNVSRWIAIRRVLRSISPDVVVAFMPEPNVVTLLASIGQRWSVVVSERAHPAYVPLRRIPAAMRRMTYPLADAVVAQTKPIADYIETHFGTASFVLPNPLDLEEFPARDESRSLVPDRYRVISVGRLEHQKGLDLLIDSFAKIASNAPLWDLVIFGEGPLRRELESRAIGHGLADRISLPGVTADIAGELRKADLYVHSSRFEGYPNAVMEALACGCPVIATNSPGGVRELLQDGSYGRLVPVENVEALAGEMVALMSDPDARSELRAKARESVAGFAVERVAEQWIAMFRQLRADMHGVADWQPSVTAPDQ